MTDDIRAAQKVFARPSMFGGVKYQIGEPVPKNINLQLLATLEKTGYVRPNPYYDAEIEMNSILGLYKSKLEELEKENQMLKSELEVLKNVGNKTGNQPTRKRGRKPRSTTKSESNG